LEYNFSDFIARWNADLDFPNRILSPAIDWWRLGVFRHGDTRIFIG